MGQLVNQHQLAAKLKRSRASIIAWAKEGLPVARRGGHGRPTLYDLDQVLAWIERNGVGVRPELPPMPSRAEVYTAPVASEARAGAVPANQGEQLLARVLEEGLGGIVALLLAQGIPGELALSTYDCLVVAAYSVLEKCTGRADSMIPMDGALGLLMDDDGRKSLLDYAQRVAATIGPAHSAPAMVN